jgi:hypothetical protein
MGSLLHEKTILDEQTPGGESSGPSTKNKHLCPVPLRNHFYEQHFVQIDRAGVEPELAGH